MNDLERILKIRQILGCDEGKIAAFMRDQGVGTATTLIWAQQGSLALEGCKIIKKYCSICGNSGIAWVPFFEKIENQRRAYCSCEKGAALQFFLD